MQHTVYPNSLGYILDDLPALAGKDFIGESVNIIAQSLKKKTYQTMFKCKNCMLLQRIAWLNRSAIAIFHLHGKQNIFRLHSLSARTTAYASASRWFSAVAISYKWQVYTCSEMLDNHSYITNEMDCVSKENKVMSADLAPVNRIVTVSCQLNNYDN